MGALAQLAKQADESEDPRPLGERLRLQPGEEIDPIPTVIFRKYLVYARKYASPVLSEGAKHELQAFYLKLRQQSTSVNSAPITTRQLESMMRLAQGRARCEMREEVTTRDALDVIEIMKASLLDIHETAEGCIDFTRQGVTGGGKKMQFAKKIMQVLRGSGHTEWQLGALSLVIKGQGWPGEPKEMIDFLNEHNFLLLGTAPAGPGGTTIRIYKLC